MENIIKIILKGFLFVFIFNFYLSGQYKNLTADEESNNNNDINLQHLKSDYSSPFYFPLQNQLSKKTVPCLIEGTNEKLIMIWSEKTGSIDTIYTAESTDNGLNWSNKKFIHTVASNTNTTMHLTGVKTNTGRILVIFSNHRPANESQLRYFYSDDNGNNWSNVLNISSGIYYRGRYPVLSTGSDGKLWLTYSTINSRIIFRYSDNDGISWGSTTLYPPTSGGDFYGNVVPIDNNDLRFFTVSSNQLISRVTTDLGNSWIQTDIINTHGEQVTGLSAKKNSDGIIWILYQSKRKSDNFERFQDEIYYTKSSDNGITWSLPVPFTNYADSDVHPSLAFNNNQPITAFSSNRFDTKNNIWLGKPGITLDNKAPPVLLEFGHGDVIRNQPVQFTASIDSYLDIQEVKLNYAVNSVAQQSVELFDDGLHGDGGADDNIWGNTAGPFLYTDTVKYFISISDIAGNSITSHEKSFVVPQTDFYIFDINYVWMPISPDGVLGDVNYLGGRFEDIVFLFSGGFFLSGVTNGTMWGNGVQSASRINDYQPGKVGSHPGLPENSIYVLNNSDQHFGESWQKWRDAVDLGADFYDGDGDGIYNPVDKNGNGIWDPDEDRPDLIGNVTAWSVINDGVLADQRRFDVDPQGVEIHQTFFAFGNTEYSLVNTFFIRYRIFNKSGNDWDSLYFAIAVDPDLGNYTDDLTGCDSLSNSGFFYNDGPDAIFGTDPPAFFTTLLQGPKVYIPGETFIDINGNGIYDAGIDVPIDTALNVRGPQLGIDLYPGAKNLEMTSFTPNMKSHPTHGDANTHYELRNYLLGGVNKAGMPIDPCTWAWGHINGVSCSEVNPKFMYSGDPETDIGWINNVSVDVRGLTNAGPFYLSNNESVDIIVAYVIGRGSSATNSVTVVRSMVSEIFDVFNQNYPVVVGVEQKPNIVSDFKLYQNYPNPFNPSTVISYQLPEAGRVSLKIYDLLGREIVSLVNEEKQAGNYQVQFDASNLASGLYFYRLKTEKFVETKKMILLR